MGGNRKGTDMIELTTINTIRPTKNDLRLILRIVCGGHILSADRDQINL